MSLLDRLLRRGGSVETEVQAGPCPHISLSARWDSVKDMGDDSKATGYVCICGDAFSPEDGKQMRATVRERLERNFAQNQADTSSSQGSS